MESDDDDDLASTSLLALFGQTRPATNS
jgi:hypothetical protein